MSTCSVLHLLLTEALLLLNLVDRSIGSTINRIIWGGQCYGDIIRLGSGYSSLKIVIFHGSIYSIIIIIIIIIIERKDEVYYWRMTKGSESEVA